MQDLISRQAALDALGTITMYKGSIPYDTAVMRIEQLPSAEPKRGKWVLVCDNNGMHFICDKCGAWRYYQEQNFCGECGADMREVTT